MEELRAFLKTLSFKEQQQFAFRCNTTIGYLRKALSKGAIFSTELCVNIERESNGLVTRKHLVPNWEARWPELAKD